MVPTREKFVISHILSSAVPSLSHHIPDPVVVHIPSLMLGCYQRDQFIDLNISAPAKRRDSRRNNLADAGYEKRSVAP